MAFDFWAIIIGTVLGGVPVTSEVTSVTSSCGDLPSFLQVTMDVHPSWPVGRGGDSDGKDSDFRNATVESGSFHWMPKNQTWNMPSNQLWQAEAQSGHEVTLEKEKVTPLLHFVSEFSKGVIILVYAGLLMMVLSWMLCGLPKKAPQHERVQDGCPTSWAIFLCITYSLVWSTTDQYVPSLPQMGIDLSGSQGVMSATVQTNFVVKSVFGLLTASLSDRLGRRPAMVSCLSLLTVTTLCCGCAGRIEWFFAGRFLQGVGESVEPVILASCRDYFHKPEERLVMVAAVQMMAIGSQSIAPILGGLLSVWFDWRFTFFLLSFLWASLAFYCWRFMLESCPDLSDEVGEVEESHDSLKDLRKVLAPGIICLLLTNACVNAPFSIFNANIAFVAEVSYGLTPLNASFLLLAWGVVDALGFLLLRWLMAFDLSILQVSRIFVVMVAIAGIVSMVLGIFAEYLWAYMTACSLQSLLLASALVALSVLYNQPLENCAGLASSVEILFKHGLAPLYSMICTQALIHSGVQSYMNLQSVTYVVAMAFYLGYEILERPKERKDASCNSEDVGEAKESDLSHQNFVKNGATG